MKIQLIASRPEQVKASVLAIPVFEEDAQSGAKSTFRTPFDITNAFLKDHPKFGKLYETQLLFTPNQKYLLVGAGKKEKFDYSKAQNLAGTAVRHQLNKSKDMALMVTGDFAEAYVIGAEIASYNPLLIYKSDHEKQKLDTVQLIVEKGDKQAQDGLKHGSVLSDAINLVRRLGDMPANEMMPSYFLSVVKKVAKENKLKVTVIDEKQAKKLGMGAFVGVAQGSDQPSYIIALDYKGDLRSKEKWGVVGKGITFDSGGISLKPSAGMHEMKYDMCGAASVLAVLLVVAKLKLKVNLAGVMAVTENLPGGRAQRPGDIVKSYSGKTVEVLNTDAEGRLVLIDALTYVQKNMKATKLIDLATLTGAVVVALGEHRTGVFGNNPQFTQSLIFKGAGVGEKFWELPMDEEYDELLKSNFADMANAAEGPSAKAGAGAIFGAKFLEKVIEKDRPWVHLDIAGTAWDLKNRPYRSPGATGIGVKTLIKLIRENI